MLAKDRPGCVFSWTHTFTNLTGAQRIASMSCLLSSPLEGGATPSAKLSQYSRSISLNAIHRSYSSTSSQASSRCSETANSATRPASAGFHDAPADHDNGFLRTVHSDPLTGKRRTSDVGWPEYPLQNISAEITTEVDSDDTTAQIQGQVWHL